MRRGLTTLLAWMLLWPLAHPQSADPQKEARFSVSVNLIKVPFSVFDESGGLVKRLRRENFLLYEDGIQQEIRSFGTDRKPVSVVLVIDASGSSEKEEKELKKIKEAAEGFINALSREDQVSVIAFADDAELILDWTNDKKLSRKTIRNLEPGFRTALYDAMFMAANDMLHEVEGRKAIILLTDGLNNQSRVGFKDASLSIIQSQASLYVVSKTVMARQAAKNQRRVRMLAELYEKNFGEDNYIDEFFRKREEELRDLADKTGGRAFFPTSYDRIKDVYREVARELKSKYYLTYVSKLAKAPNSYHTISLDYLPPSSKITHRKGYYFEPEPLQNRWYHGVRSRLPSSGSSRSKRRTRPDF